MPHGKPNIRKTGPKRSGFAARPWTASRRIRKAGGCSAACSSAKASSRERSWRPSAALEAHPDSAETAFLLGCILAELRQRGGDGLFPAHSGRSTSPCRRAGPAGRGRAELGHLDEAIGHFRQALCVRPGLGQGPSTWESPFSSNAKWEELANAWSKHAHPPELCQRPLITSGTSSRPEPTR